jgi:cytochrome c oxidase subunit 1/cytochrome c oxidase subunit I+III
MHLAGLAGMPRRVVTYRAGDGVTLWNQLSTIGAFLLTVGLLIGLYDLLHAWRSGPRATDDPWGGDTLEWATASPPRPFNFARIPIVGGRHPLWQESGVTESELVLADGHQALGTTPVDAAPLDVLDMPRASWSPLLFALGLMGASYGLLLEWPVLVVVGAVVAVGGLVRWHVRSDR